MGLYGRRCAALEALHSQGENRRSVVPEITRLAQSRERRGGRCRGSTTSASPVRCGECCVGKGIDGPLRPTMSSTGSAAQSGGEFDVGEIRTAAKLISQCGGRCSRTNQRGAYWWIRGVCCGA